MNYSYHNHTYLCGHAEGTMEEYVKRALEKGIKYMGFSEHFPYVFSDGSQSHYRLKVEDINIYKDEVKRLKEKYKNEIDIKMGFEIEYYPELFPDMIKKAGEYGADYLILGQHFLIPEYIKDTYVIRETKDEAILKTYVDLVTEAIRSGVFTYVAHPDIINFRGDEEIFKSEFKRLCMASKEEGIPLEINFLGIRGKRNYPREDAVCIMGEVKNPVTFGFDAHDVLSAFDEESLIKAKEMTIKYGINYIGKPNLIKIG